MSLLERDGAMRVAALLLAVVVLVVAEGDKRAEMSPVPFVLGSRYGRAAHPGERGDRFFMGTRYGKRSGDEGGGGGGVTSPLSGGAGGGSGVTSSLLCEPLGALYRCQLAPRWLDDNRRLEGESFQSEEQ